MSGPKSLVTAAVSVAVLLLGAPAAAAEPDVVRGMQWQLTGLDLAAVHQRATGAGVLVAVLDSGVDRSHPDLAGQVLGGPDAASNTDVDGRGTGLAGLIAGHGHVPPVPAGVVRPAATPSASAGWPAPSQSAAAVGDPRSAGVLGVAPGAQILPIAFAPAPGATGDPDALATAIDRAVFGGAKIVCIGRGVVPSSRLQASVDAAVARGVLIVAADADRAGRPFTPWPASYSGVLNAIPADRSGQVPVAPLSGRTTGITVPGVDLITTGVGGGYRMDGGSSAAAVLAGAAAVVWSAYPQATLAQVLQRLRTTATDAGAPGADSRFGAGMLNLSAALAANLPQEPAPSVSPSPAASSPAASPSGSPLPVALADSRDWRRWLVVLPLLLFLAGLTVWAVRSARVRQQAA
ncbi:S8 family serine peptidase [Catellatospora citrea]|uniref:Type VII secretion-associated serine protease n=1 Tax=Catellatospora citrea TaxID=53366 RepID=A0A8J3KK94_9ACTN|nr:S8 family serine peptidase [Catellatospora citrea]RKE09497.1 subtilase family protein [Catellatospora citrea]GIF97459.1 type VII secretion-associated serine protease [Catellatospora citrea]